MEQKNNKLLYIDYMFMRGHVNFNRVHIDALLKEGYNVKLVLHKEIASLLPYAYQQYALVIPRILGTNVILLNLGMNFVRVLKSVKRVTGTDDLHIVLLTCQPVNS